MLKEDLSASAAWRATQGGYPGCARFGDGTRGTRMDPGVQLVSEDLSAAATIGFAHSGTCDSLHVATTVPLTI